MPRFEPFRSLRYAPEIVQHVTAPPYDVLSPADRDELASRHRFNIVHVDVPIESDGPDRYEAAAHLLHTWRTTGVLQLDPNPSFTIYRMNFIDESGAIRHCVGVIGALEVVDENAGGVLPHERTTPKAKTDRLDLTRATKCNLSPVWGLSLGQGLTSLLLERGEVMGKVEVDGVEHIFERVTDPERVSAIRSSVSESEVVIADGHHRYAISRTYRDEIRSRHQPWQTSAELTMTYVAELITEQLSVAAIHRLYTLPKVDEWMNALHMHFQFEPVPQVTRDITSTMKTRGCLVLLLPTGEHSYLVPRADMFVGVRDLDGSRLEHALRDVPHEVTYQHGVDEVLGLLHTDSVDAAILIRPVSVEEIRRTATEHLLMPPKSTFFTPKLLTGASIRPLED